MINKLVSIMIPSRGRGDRLIGCLENLYSKASDPNQIEALIKIDSDDINSYAPVIEDIKKITHGNCKILISDRLEGYWSLHHAWNDLSAISQGEFLFLCNDDFAMSSNDWDLVIKEYSGRVCIIQGYSNKCDLRTVEGSRAGANVPLYCPFTFPIAHRAVYDTVGYLSPTPFNDNYLHDLAKLTGLEVYDKRILFYHERANWYEGEKHRDETYKNGAETSISRGPEWEKHYDIYKSVINGEVMRHHALALRERLNGPELV